MKIVQVLGGAEDGGLEKHVIELTHSLKDTNIDISVIAHKKFKKDFKGINFIELDLSKGRRNPFILYKLYRILKQGNFDIIHTQASKATDMVIRLKPFLKAKIVSTLHSYKKNIKSFEKSDFVITVSDKIREKLKNKNVFTIYNGINFTNIEKIDLHKKYNIPKDKFVACSVGRFVGVKRFDMLLKSIKNIDIHLILVGDGERKKELALLAKKLFIENKVTFTNYLAPKETKEIIASSKLFIMTSQKEGFPYTFIEAMLYKIPFISTDVSDIKKIIGEKFIVPFEDTKKLEEKIEYVKSNYDTIIKDFTHSFKFATNEFTKENMVKKTIGVYKKAMI